MRLPPVVHVTPAGFLDHLPPHHPALLPQARVRHRQRRQVSLVCNLTVVYFLIGQLFIYIGLSTFLFIYLYLFTFLRKGAAQVSKITDAAVETAKDIAAEQQLNKSD